MRLIHAASTTVLALLSLVAASAEAQIVVTEVSPTGSSNSTYKADWFELTNRGAGPVDLSGWKMDDDSNSFASAVSLRGATSIAAGQSVVFVETASTTTDFAVVALFKAAWFGSGGSTVTVGSYGGSGVGLSASGDQVNIFNSGGSQIAHVLFGQSTSGVSFDNSSGLNNATLTQLSVVGRNGAFTSAAGGEVGSPGSIASVPEPEGYALALAGIGAIGIAARRQRNRKAG